MPDNVYEFVRTGIEPSLFDVHSMLRLPITDSCEANCGFSIVAVLLNVVSGASTLLYSSTGKSGRRFVECLESYYPWDGVRFEDDVVESAASHIIYRQFRNPFTHSFGVETEVHERNGVEYVVRKIRRKPRRVGVSRLQTIDGGEGLGEAAIEEIELGKVWPPWLGPTVEREPEGYKIYAEALYRGVRLMIERLCSDPDRMDHASRFLKGETPIGSPTAPSPSSGRSEEAATARARRRLPSAKPDQSDGPDRQVRYGYYFVAFIDLLGQRDRLRPVAEIQWDTALLPDAQSRLRQSAGPVRRVRRALENFFNLAAENRTKSLQLTPDQLSEYNRMRRLAFKQHGFSDCFVVSIPLTEGEFGRAPAATAVWAALYGIAGMSLAAMAEGVPLRGGIDVGFAVDMFPNEAYGPPLLSAYELESKDAHYPRILIGEGVHKYVSYIAQPKGADGRYGSMVNNIAEDCRQLIIHAPDDQKMMLHMLSAKFVGEEFFKRPAAVAYEWAKHERAQFEVAKNEKLTGYYGRLLRYFNVSGFTD